MTTIVRFKCGCIGTKPDTEGTSTILAACDGDGPGAMMRPMQTQDYKEIDYREELWTFANDSYKYRQMKQVMRVLVEE